jgi:hypothetical protein
MPKSDAHSETGEQTASAEDVRRILGDMDDSTAVAILALRPSAAQLEAARVWLAGAGDLLGKEGRPLDGVVAAIFDLLNVEEEEEPPRR